MCSALNMLIFHDSLLSLSEYIDVFNTSFAIQENADKNLFHEEILFLTRNSPLLGAWDELKIRKNPYNRRSVAKPT